MAASSTSLVPVCADLTAIGPASHHRWQKPLPAEETVRLGRAPRHGWQVAWDPHISREHADIMWKDGQLHIHCLPSARNLVECAGTRGSDFVLSVGETFKIGTTRFFVSAPADDPEGIQELVVDGKVGTTADAARRLQFVMKLPDIIASTRTDEELAERLTALLLDAMPHIQAAATTRFESLKQVEEGRSPMIRWDSRKDDSEPFAPSRKLIRAAVHRGKGVLHSFLKGGGDGSEYTMSAGMDWAICTPISSHGPDHWCLYVAGASDDVPSEDTLRADLSFTTLMAQFIGSVRQVRQLEKIQANMSQFFSPTVAEMISRRSGSELAAPRVSDITVLFCDVRGFSAMTEKAGEDLLPVLKRVSVALGMMTRNIIRHDGVIADFQGDAALGFWGWPLAPDDGAVPACRAALGIENGFLQAQTDPEDPLYGIRIAIGLSYGRAIAGQIGSDEQIKVGVFGPHVNLGARLQSMTKQLRVDILMDEATALQAREGLGESEGRCRWLGEFRPVGVANSLQVSQLLPPAQTDSDLTAAQIEEFESAVETFSQGDWNRAKSLFEAFPEEGGPRLFFLDYMAQHNGTPPTDWDGVVGLIHK